MRPMHKEGTPDIRYLFEPRSIAIIGASADERKIGHKVLRNALEVGYKGKVHPINPKGGEILGLKAHKSILDVEGDVDVAFIAIPAKYVFDAVKECAAKGVKFLPIITSGFSEVGDIELERDIVSYARGHGMRVLGPNIFGIYSARASLNGTFGPRDIRPGNVAIISQSGALGISMIGMAGLENIGLSTIVSIGNKSDIDEADLVEYLMEDELTKVIFMYIEGIHDGHRLVDVFSRATRKKPVVVIKSGRSKRGAQAAASHTGSLAGADDIFDDIMGQCGVIRAEDLDEAFDWCKFLANSPRPKGEETVIVTNGGGIGVMATDACEKYGIKLYEDLDVLHKAFSPVTPDFGSTKNPVDITGQASASDYDGSLMAALDSDHMNAVIALYCETAVVEAAQMRDMISGIYGRYKAKDKPILFSLVGGEKVEGIVDDLRRKGVPVFSDVYGAVSCLGMLYSHYRHLKEVHERPVIAEMDEGAIRKVIRTARHERRHFLLSHEGAAIARAVGIEPPRAKLARNLQEAVTFAEEIGYPVAMKIVSKDIVHKSDAGGVALGLDDEKEVMDAYQAIMHNARAYDPGAVLMGVEVAEMVKKGTETIIGARRDPAFGPVIMFGLGGIYVEVMKDVAFRALPLGNMGARNMIKSIRSYPLLLGVRGEKRKDIDWIVDTIIKVGTVIKRFEEISDIEVNPLFVYDIGKGARAVDIRVLLSKPEAGGKYG
jgi:acetyl coenzyme A synthetase (ADP forming)-like protein